MTTRSARRARAREGDPQPVTPRTSRLRLGAFGIIVVAVLAAGAYLAFGDLLGRSPAALGATEVQSSMAGFSPSVIHVTAGQTATIDWWTNDAAMHLQDGVHTMISPELGLYERLPAEGRRAITWQVPDKPGTYDVYCDSCCGGKDSPTMHGTIIVHA
jgi:cytochrome c oxidase subunit 2